MFYLFAAALPQPKILEISSRNLSRLTQAPVTQSGPSIVRINWNDRMGQEWYSLERLLTSISNVHTLDISMSGRVHEATDPYQENFVVICKMLECLGSSVTTVVLRAPNTIYRAQSNKISDSLKSFIQELSEIAPSVTCVDLDGYLGGYLGDGGSSSVPSLVDAIRQSSSIKSVRLQRQNLSPIAASQLFELPLISLDLCKSIAFSPWYEFEDPEDSEDPSIEIQGAETLALADAVAETSIERIYFADIEVTGVFQGLGYNSHTRVLSVAQPLSDDDLTLLGEALSRNHTLKVLSLRMQEFLEVEESVLLLQVLRNSLSLRRIIINEGNDVNLQKEVDKITERNLTAVILSLITGKQKRSHTLSRLSNDEFSVIREFLTR